MASLAGSVVGSPRLSMRAARRWRFGSAADAGSKAAVEWCSNQSIAATTRSRDRNVWAFSADDIYKIVLTIPPFSFRPHLARSWSAARDQPIVCIFFIWLHANGGPFWERLE